MVIKIILCIGIVLLGVAAIGWLLWVDYRDRKKMWGKLFADIRARKVTYVRVGDVFVKKEN